MKPRNFVINILIVLLSIAQIILTFLGKEVPWWTFFVGLAGILFLFPDWFFKPKHRVLYIVYKSFAILLFVLLSLGSAFVGTLLVLVYEIAEDLAESCGGTTSFTQYDKFVANYTAILTVLYIAKVGMLITDLATYRKDRKKLAEN